MDSHKRAKILKAAIKIFARDGFFNAKVEEIAKEAGVATGTTYLYFDNKDDILISIFEEEMIPIIETMRNAISKKATAREKIIEIITCHLKMMQEKADMGQLLELELRQSSKFIHGYQGTRFKEYLDIMGETLAVGQESGEFRNDIHPVIFKQILFGALDQISMNWSLSKSRKIDLHLSADQIAAVLLDGIEKKGK
ncbi:MAG TPA: TetR/AcrR family transcriptional regulator [bacterium]|nr:TetR/AcrR family transcriptional regulator [bacterium]HPN42444.1 TetR/AcrR family transcriptional regulator [bacterium]